MRLYPSTPNAHTEAMEDICIEDMVTPKRTNMWIDVVVMNHDLALWGDDVNEFRPERSTTGAGIGWGFRHLDLGLGFVQGGTSLCWSTRW